MIIFEVITRRKRGLIRGNHSWDPVKERVIIARVTMEGTEVNHLMIIP
jgi:hypothetical protein